MHTLSWLAWLGSALVAVGLTNNPLYLLLVMLATLFVFTVWRDDRPLAQTYRLFFLVGLALWGGYVLFSVVTVGGARGQTVLAKLPALRLPALLGGITLGGPITAEDIVWGAVRGLRLWTLLAVFGAFNALVDHYRLLRLTPRSLFSAGLVVTIGVSFVPQVVRAIGEIRDSQRVRGYRFGGPRSYAPLVSPLLAGSLEKSIQLAEALDARGYGRARAADRALGRQQLGVIIGLTLLGAGLFGWLYYGAGALAGALLLTGVGLLGLALRALGRLVPRTTYRRERWRPRDTLVVGAAIAGAAGLLALRALGAGAQVFNPYPVASLPPFEPLAGLLLVTLAVPGLARPAPTDELPRRGAGPVRRPAAAADSPGPLRPAAVEPAHNELHDSTSA